MRSSVRHTLVALALVAAPTTSAHAALFDGSENAGHACQATFVAQLSGGYTHSGVITGGPWVAADLLENRDGIVGVESVPGTVTDMRITCFIRRVGNAYDIPVSGTSSSPTSSGLVYFAPKVFSFDSYYDTFQTCTQVDWTDTHGVARQESSCNAPQTG